jgi:hypothetical protein
MSYLNYTRNKNDNTDLVTNSYIMAASYLQGFGDILVCTVNTGAPKSIDQWYIQDGIKGRNATIKNIYTYVGTFNFIDAESNQTETTVVAIDETGATDQVYYQIIRGTGNFLIVTFGGGAPGLNWRTVGCDRGLSGTSIFLIGDDAGGGNPVCRRSAGGQIFNTVSGFPTMTGSSRGIFHTHHPAGALAPSGSGTGQDPGNLSWLYVTDTQVSRSVDGITWYGPVAHGAAGTMHRKCAAYSRTSSRWVIPHQDTSGSIVYSDDNGASWTTLSGIIPGAIPSGEKRIFCDGYGTFIIFLDGTSESMFISVDDGMTWTNQYFFHGDVSGITEDTRVQEIAFDTRNNWDSTPEFPTGMFVATKETATQDAAFYTSMVY